METLRVVVAHRPPFVFVTSSNGSPFYYGLLIDLLNKVLALSPVPLNASFYESPANSGGTRDATTGRWSGVIGELVEGRADVALFPLTRTGARLDAIECTFSYLDEGLSLLVKVEDQTPGPLSVLAPFATTLWVLLLCTVLTVAVLFWLLDVYGKWVRKKQSQGLRTQNPEALDGVRRRSRSHVMVSLMAAAGVPERPTQNSWGVQVLFVAYAFFCLIFLSAYTANLTAFLSVTRVSVSVTGLQSLLSDNLLMGVNPNGSTAAYFSSSYDTLATQLQPNVRYCATPTCIEWVRSGQVAAFVSDKPLLQYQANQPPCDLAVVQDVFGPGNLVVGLPKNSSLLPLFNSAIQRFSEDGTLTSLRRAWFDAQSRCSGDAQISNNQLGIAQMVGPFGFLLFGILVAFIMGTVENLRWCLVRAYTDDPRYREAQASGRHVSLVKLASARWRDSAGHLWRRMSRNGGHGSIAGSGRHLDECRALPDELQYGDDAYDSDLEGRASSSPLDDAHKYGSEAGRTSRVSSSSPARKLAAAGRQEACPMPPPHHHVPMSRLRRSNPGLLLLGRAAGGSRRHVLPDSGASAHTASLGSDGPHLGLQAASELHARVPLSRAGSAPLARAFSGLTAANVAVVSVQVDCGGGGVQSAAASHDAALGPPAGAYPGADAASSGEAATQQQQPLAGASAAPTLEPPPDDGTQSRRQHPPREEFCLSARDI